MGDGHAGRQQPVPAVSVDGEPAVRATPLALHTQPRAVRVFVRAEEPGRTPLHLYTVRSLSSHARGDRA